MTAPWPGKVFGGSSHAGVPHAVHIGHGELADDLGTLVESPGADRLIHPEIEVDDRGEGDIDPMRPQLCRHEPARAPRQLQPAFRVLIEGMTDQAGRWEA